MCNLTIRGDSLFSLSTSFRMKGEIEHRGLWLMDMQMDEEPKQLRQRDNVGTFSDRCIERTQLIGMVEGKL